MPPTTPAGEKAHDIGRLAFGRVFLCMTNFASMAIAIVSRPANGCTSSPRCRHSGPTSIFNRKKRLQRSRNSCPKNLCGNLVAAGAEMVVATCCQHGATGQYAELGTVVS